ncbi:DoxX family protein [Undibacterium fentianense]|uniref:DoxX family protein n=1 Tax=Undibacterium fentianense TaxID=2828728 RepID=A0A941E1Z1_9BURK|nr:DoxX family protein [Undibacterium fentianense]MBR7799169.1 DoxX family protein [Undibacterium fentianense]
MKMILNWFQRYWWLEKQIQVYLKDLVMTLVRVYVAWQFFRSGLVKFEDWQSTVSLFVDEYHVPVLSPEIAALIGTAGELILPILLVVGLVSRFSALGLFVLNLVAIMSYPILWTLDCPAALNDHFYWGVLLAVLFVGGAGKWSLDTYFMHRWGVNK